MKTLNIFFFTAIYILFALSASSQNMKTDENGTMIESVNKSPRTEKESVQSAELEKIHQQMKEAKLSGDAQKVLALQKIADKLCGSVTITPVGFSSLVKFNEGQPENDNITVKAALIKTNVKAYATATEQRGSTAGRIWMAAAYGGPAGSTDTLVYLYSDDGGTSWTLFAKSPVISGGTVVADEMDIEIIESIYGEKKLWTVYTVMIGTTEKAYLSITQTPTLAQIQYELSWPGNVETNYSQHVRLTSDNAAYTSIPWVYIVIVSDSMITSDWHGVRRKNCICSNPYSLYPSLTIFGNEYSSFYGTGSGYVDHCRADLAYYKYGSNDSIIEVTDFNDFDLHVFKYSIYSFATGGPNYSDIYNWSSPFEYPKIASNGAYPYLCIVGRRNYLNSGDWDVVSYYSVNGGTTWYFNYVDGSGENSYHPDIMGIRNSTGSFKASWVNLSTFDDVYTSSCLMGSWGSRQKLNHIDGSFSPNPRAGFRRVNNDSCITFWSEYNYLTGNNVWASSGCGGLLTFNKTAPVTKTENALPGRFELFQNYPNPFNPETKIRFDIPSAGMSRELSSVHLIVYDMLGHEVETLINETMKAGTYSVVWNASKYSSGVYFYKLTANGFTDTKKMLLVK